MTPADEQKVRKLIEETIHRTVKQSTRESMDYMFTHFGLDAAKEGEVPEIQQDFAYIRRLRRGSELVKTTAITTCVGALLSGVLYLLWDGLRSHLTK